MSAASFENTFSQPLGCLFDFLMVSFVVQKLLKLGQLFIFAFISITVGGGSKKILSRFMSERILCFPP